jgi:hypothetical protein
MISCDIVPVLRPEQIVCVRDTKVRKILGFGWVVDNCGKGFGC